MSGNFTRTPAHNKVTSEGVRRYFREHPKYDQSQVEKLITLYVDKKLSTHRISRIVKFKISSSTVSYILIKKGIKMRGKNET